MLFTFVMLLLVQYWGGLHLICCAVWEKKQAGADRQKKEKGSICCMSPLRRIGRYFHIDGMTYCHLVISDSYFHPYFCFNGKVQKTCLTLEAGLDLDSVKEKNKDCLLRFVALFVLYKAV